MTADTMIQSYHSDNFFVRWLVGQYLLLLTQDICCIGSTEKDRKGPPHSIPKATEELIPLFNLSLFGSPWTLNHSEQWKTEVKLYNITLKQGVYDI